MTTDEARALSPGLYRIEWVDGRTMDGIVEAWPAFEGLNRQFVNAVDSRVYAQWQYITRAIPLFTFPLTPNLSHLQLLALAVLRGDDGAAMGLLDEAEAAYHGRPSVEERIEAARREERKNLIQAIKTCADGHGNSANWTTGNLRKVHRTIEGSFRELTNFLKEM